ncbi:hypothetical protein L484_010686 [Morus notabilis]|uniref:Uncharacterized protein n=1 Tax=Morus notabilis TaxID=981085 RepID=W9RZQ5_9ROSA|nr:hypothetical protein L484_010686 [Morus notabilis]
MEKILVRGNPFRDLPEYLSDEESVQSEKVVRTSGLSRQSSQVVRSESQEEVPTTSSLRDSFGATSPRSGLEVADEDLDEVIATLHPTKPLQIGRGKNYCNRQIEKQDALETKLEAAKKEKKNAEQKVSRLKKELDEANKKAKKAEEEKRKAKESLARARNDHNKYMVEVVLTLEAKAASLAIKAFKKITEYLQEYAVAAYDLADWSTFLGVEPPTVPTSAASSTIMSSVVENQDVAAKQVQEDNPLVSGEEAK